MVKKTEKEIKVAIVKQWDNPSKIYQLDEINGNDYAEWAAEEIVNNISKLKIEPVPPRKTYDMNHTGDTSKDKGVVNEKNVAKELFNLDYGFPDTIGKIFDYEVPLSTKRGDGYGDIDLVSKTDDCIYLLEFKRKKSKETLLRCILEIYTYYSQLPKKEFEESFIKSGKLEKSMPVIPAILVYEDKTAHLQYTNKGFTNTVELMKKLGVKLFLISGSNGNYAVREA